MMEENRIKNNVVQPDELSETLLVFDQEKQTLQAVKEIDKNGKLKAVEPTRENNPDFIRLDKNGDFLSNFYKNFVAQLKDPTRFRVFKIPIPKIDYLAETIQSILKDPTPAGNAMLGKYEVKSETIKADVIQEPISAQQETINPGENRQKNPDNTTNPKNKETMDTTSTASDYRYKVEDIDWKTLEGMGVTQEKLQKMNVMEDLLKGFKTNQLVPISLNLGTVITRSEARLSLQPDENGNTVVAMHGVRKEANVHQPFFGHEFTPEDKENLIKHGNMGRVVMLENRKTGEQIPSIISVDRLTNELIALRADKIKIPDEIKGLKLTDEQKQTLQEGKPLYLEGMISRKGTEFNATVQFNADKRYVEFMFDREQTKQNRQAQENGEAPRFVRGKELNDEQYNKFKSGQTIYVNDLVDKKGQTYKGYLTYNVEKGKTEFSFGNPNKQKNTAKQSAQPDEASKVQKAVNSDGKTNEATKNIKETLQKGQTKPTEKQAEKQEKEQKKTRGRKL
ncbi:MAG: DUF3945 domain-containing protein [Bacteroidia bacterium]|nr:DUF3945 domain-containing protein [Bacteroidia bacterium]